MFYFFFNINWLCCCRGFLRGGVLFYRASCCAPLWAFALIWCAVEWCRFVVIVTGNIYLLGVSGMINPQLIEGLSEQFSQLLSGENKLPGQDELQQQVKALLQGTFDRLDIVSREEFDAQKAVLLRTREKVETLEKQVQALEEALQDK